MAATIKRNVAGDAFAEQKVLALNHYLFKICASAAT